MHPFLALVGSSGSGKSSLLRAGLLPALGNPAVVLRPGERSGTELLADLGRVPRSERLVIAVDQFEELFMPSVAEEERRAFIDALVEAAWDPERRAVVLLALRADFFGRLAPYGELADLVGPNHALLGPMSPAELRRAIDRPAERVGLTVEPALVDALVDDVADETGGLPLLQTACSTSGTSARDRRSPRPPMNGRPASAAPWVGTQRRRSRRSTPPSELSLVGSCSGSSRAVTATRSPDAERRAQSSMPTRTSASRACSTLVDRRLLVVGDETFELVHEALLERWERLARWVEEDAQGRRLHRHLTQAAMGWEEAGREPSELFSGARLAATMEWADAGGDAVGLNRLEREFLEESRTAFARANRRLRVLLSAAVILLLFALAAGAIALVARNSAKRQATAAIAERLGAQALVEPQLDRGLLLAREGVALDD